MPINIYWILVFMIFQPRGYKGRLLTSKDFFCYSKISQRKLYYLTTETKLFWLIFCQITNFVLTKNDSDEHNWGLLTANKHFWSFLWFCNLGLYKGRLLTFQDFFSLPQQNLLSILKCWKGYPCTMALKVYSLQKWPPQYKTVKG